MSDDVCELSDLPASMCSHCKGLDVKEEPEPAGFEAALRQSLPGVRPHDQRGRHDPCRWVQPLDSRRMWCVLTTPTPTGQVLPQRLWCTTCVVNVGWDLEPILWGGFWCICRTCGGWVGSVSA